MLDYSKQLNPSDAKYQNENEQTVNCHYRNS